ncbi:MULTISPECIES: carboxymuconolactone decarboxylase family protein [Flavobacterium]|uniref:Carboxymuconolactone decarboxylase family protein n=1 Tax=Flavobacterium hankyongi TaxID=1176532 RepID=A0ABP9A435_9FLAO|nr:carboxymuconolactone decarboxylase family protein [Flavobacterium sp. N1846]
MTRLNALSPDQATGKTKELFNAIESKLGMVPNMMRTMGNSPALLEGYLNLSGALGGGALGAKTGELIAIAVATNNNCDYCLTAHNYIGGELLKIDGETLNGAKRAHSTDTKTNAILQFAKALSEKRGLVSDEEINAVKDAGVSEGQIAEIVGHVGLNLLTNYFNHVANTTVDFTVFNTATV